MKLNLLFVLFLASLSSFAQYTLIPDVNFETELISQGIDSGIPDGKVLTSKINTLTSLNVLVKSITDLTGIQDFTSLKSLRCDSNRLTALDVSKNTALTYLSCGDNGLTVLDVSKNIALTYLSCNNNQLTALDVSKNTALSILYCHDNQLKTLDLSKNTALTYLDCSSNQLTGLNLKNGNNSKLGTNSVFNGNPNLICIQVDNVAYSNANWIAKDTMSSYSLDCSTVVVVQYTLIPDVNFEKRFDSTIDGKVETSKISGIISLDISNLSITNLTGIQDFVALQVLNCSGNQLTALDVSKNTALKSIDCSYNQLTVLDFSKNTALKYLSCYTNQLSSLNVSQNASLIELSCYSNQLTSLDVSKSIALTKLYCYSNQLTALDVSKNSALLELNCSSNQLTSLNVKNGKNNFLSTKEFTKNPNLSCIQVDNVAYANANWSAKKDATASYNIDCLSSTLIPDVNFETKLITLGIDSGTVDGQVPTYKINTLTSLDVSNSSIADLTGIQVFVGLRSLNCSGNQLTALDFSKNIALTSLNCSSNQLTSLNLKNGNNTYLNTRNFTNNPNLSCIQVDNVVNSNINWASAKDTTARYSVDCSVAVQYTLIPDVNFEKKLIALGFDSETPDGKVPTINISSLTSLNVSSSNIADLTGIQDFVALTILYCNNNQLPALDVSKNIALISLDCGRNKLTSLDVSKNTALYSSLNCSSNQLTSLDVSKNTALISLDCYNNQLTTLDVSKNTTLSDLSCGGNQLTVLDVSKNTILSRLYCGGNQLTVLDVSKNGNLLYFGCDSNQLSTLDVSKNTALINLYCTSNKLTALYLPINTSLTFLHCYSNRLTALDVSKSTSLTTLYCYSNRLTGLDLSKNIALKSLSCYSNQLTSLSVSANIALKDLDCSSNQLAALDVSKNTALTSLNCATNQLTALDTSKNNLLTTFYCGTNQLTSLIIGNSFNGFVSIDLKNNPNLSCIQVRSVAYFNYDWPTAKDATASYSENCSALVAVTNEFEDKLIALGIDTYKNGSVLLSNIKNVTYLDVSNSGITSLSGIEYFTNLETLICKGNLLTNLNVSSNLALKYLDCSNNSLSALDVSKNTKLTELYCDGTTTVQNKMSNAKTSVGNQLTALDVSNNLLLTKLSCSSNQIASLDLSKNILLTGVNCSNNLLTSLNLSNGNNSKLSNVSFKTNPLLSCIQVDDVAYANANWSTAKDATAIYSKTACALGIEDVVFDKIAVYPNPTKGEIHINTSIVEKATAYDALGKLVKTIKFAKDSNKNSINLTGMPSGIYYIYLESKGATLVKKIILE